MQDLVPGHSLTASQPTSIIPSPLLVRLVRVRPGVVDLGHPGDGAEPLAGLSLQLLPLVGGVVGQRDGQWSGVVFL